MGIPAVPPEMPVPARSREHGLSREDFIVVWPGGVWDWLDPLTAVEAIGLLPDVKLLFPGLQHPSPEIAANMTVPAAVTRRATELGLLGTQVIAGEWVPYLERARYLLGADLAVSLNHDTLESRFAIRSRLLDCIWASLPVVATEGDAIVEHMVAHGVASTVPADEPAALAEAILAWRRRLRSGDELGSRFAALAPRYYWSNVCQPLINYLRRLEAEDNELRRLQVRMPVCRKLRQEELISLPFDQYQRHRRAAELVNVLQNAGDERINLLDVGGGPGILRSFIGEASRVVSYDLAVQPGAASVTGDASSMPFADGCFDFVVSLDTLEHLPAERRSLMIEECIRVSRRGVVLSCPFSSEEANQAERLLHSFHNMALAREQHQLLEHIKNGLPRRDWLEGYLQQAGWRFAAGPSGQVHRWLAMMLAKHYLMTMPNSETLHRELDEAYNRRYYEADQVAPSYRWTYFISKLGQQGDLDTATSVLAGGLSAAAALQPLAQDNMLRLIELMATDLENGAPSLLTNAVRGAADRHRHIANLEEAISVKDEYIADLRSHLTKIERGRLMRLLNRFRSLRGASD